MPTIPGKQWHHNKWEEALEQLDSDADNGLDLVEVDTRRNRFGPNAITERKGQGPLLRFLLQFHQPLIYILIAAGIITAALGERVDSVVIFGVVLINAVVGFIQEGRALAAIAALSKTMVAECNVLRSGEIRRVSAIDIVPGDIVLLKSGDKVPADMRLLHVRDLQIDESMLTGESIPVQKESGVLKAKTVLGDRSNMAYASTLVTYGQGKGVVTAIGNDTEVGRIAKLLSATEELKTPLTLKIARFSHVLLYVILGVAAVTLAVGIARGNHPTDMFMAVVAFGVGAISEGLPAAITIILAIGVSRMARRRAIIRKLPAVETLGSTTIICTDKTGTLTENQMTVQAVYDYHNIYKVTGVGYELEGRIFCDDQTIDESPSLGLVACLRCRLLYNDSLLVEKEGRWEIQGDPTEGALIVAAHKAGLSHEVEIERMLRIESIPFESQHQYMATLHNAGPNQPPIIYIKGAVESILEKCPSVPLIKQLYFATNCNTRR